MIEKRRSQRAPVYLTLSICDLYKQNVCGIHQLDAPIDVTDISEHGIGFISECILPLQYHFDASMDFGDGNSFTTSLKIIRCTIIDKEHYAYGCELVAPKDDVLTKIRKYVSKKC